MVARRRHVGNATVQEEEMTGREAAKEVMMRLVLKRDGHFLWRLLGGGGGSMLGVKFPLDRLEPLEGADELLDDFAPGAEGWHQFGGEWHGLVVQERWRGLIASRWPHPAWGLAQMGKRTKSQMK